MGLAERIAAVRAGSGDVAALVGELRRSVVLVPRVGDGLLTVSLGGVRWVCAFTGEAALARFAVARGAAAGEGWEYVAVLGARLLDRVVPGWGVPAGVAVDVADAEGAMLFPPVAGVVPDAVAVDVTGEQTVGGAGAGVRA